MKEFLRKHKRLLWILIPTFFGILYIVLCSVNLQQSVWFDESYGAYLTRFSFGDIWSLTMADVHPPMYYFALKIWSLIFGFTDFGMRFMSVFFGAIAIIFAWQWLKRSFGVKAATVATGLMSLSPMLIRYGQEMRMYTMAAAIIFAATYVLQLAIDTKQRKYWVVYGLLMALGMWTHYFTALIFLAHLVYLIYTYRKKIFQKNIITSYVVALVAYLPWLPCFLFQSGVVQMGFWIAPTSLTTITDYFTNSFMYLNGEEVTGWLLVLAIGLITSLIFLMRKASKQIVMLGLMVLVPPVLLLLVSLPPLAPMFVDRYVIYSGVCMALVVGVSVWLVKFKFKAMPYVITGAFALASVIGIVNVYTLGNYNKVTNGRSDAKALFEGVALNSDLGEPIISQTEWLYYDLSFYGNDDHPVYFVDELVEYEWGSHEPLRRKDFGKIVDLDAFLEEHDKVWFVGNAPDEGEIDFPRQEYKILQIMLLDVNENQPAYQAVEVTRAESETDKK